MTQPWFNVDKEGLAKLLERKGKAFALFELLQNAWDENTTTVNLSLEPVPGQPRVRVTVEDDNPGGFADLSHAYTLFAESKKKSDPEKRGRFNLGEKLVLAICDDAEIASTHGTVRFLKNGERQQFKAARDVGTVFSGVLRMTRTEFEDAKAQLQTLIPPPHIKTFINGEPLKWRQSKVSFSIELPTEVADAEGVLRPTRRRTKVEVFQPLPGEVAAIYELGIPVVETGDKYHVNIHQKVPLNMDRDNVTPAYLRALRTAVLNYTFAFLDKEDATTSWVRDAASDKNADPDAVAKVMTDRFGDKRVAYDPSDTEANRRAVAEGYVVVHGGSLSAGEWANVKAADIIKPAGVVTPSPKPYSPDGQPLTELDPSKWTPGMNRVVVFAESAGVHLLGEEISVRLVVEPTWPFAATFGKSKVLVMNVGRLGKAWFENGINDDLLDLIIHELGHSNSCDHLDVEYHDALTRLGARMTRWALTKPEDFR
jgi:hypothetical protein